MGSPATARFSGVLPAVKRLLLTDFQLFTIRPAGGQVLDGGDLRARTDLAIRPRGAGVQVKARVDLLDDLGWGSTPEVGTGRAPTPAASSGQRAFTAIAVKRVWGEVLTPIGIIRRTLGGNPLEHAATGGSYWQARPEGKRRSSSLERQF